MTTYGYARVSSTDQNLDRQTAALNESGVTKIVSEKQSGGSRDGRPVLDSLLNIIADEGDVIRVKSTDRLARNTADLLEIAEQLADKGVGLEFIDNPGMNMGTAQGKLMLTVFAAFADFERSMIRERQAEGIQAAKERGVYSKPRAKKLTPEQIAEAQQRRDNGEPVTGIARDLGVSRQTLYSVTHA